LFSHDNSIKPHHPNLNFEKAGLLIDLPWLHKSFMNTYPNGKVTAMDNKIILAPVEKKWGAIFLMIFSKALLLDWVFHRLFT
jgi:hypothetical protein